MAHRDPDAKWLILGAVAAAALVLAGGGDGRAADGPPTRGGGLVPAPRKTREELIREWDLNSDGTIDQGEVEVASSRMRRERAEIRLNSGIDPITGLPRGEPLEVPDLEDADMAVEEAEPEEDPAGEADRDERPALPGTRVPRPSMPTPGRTQARPNPDGARAGAGTRAEADRKRQPTIGGVRAGGLPARAGYGAGLPAAPLNAGLPIVPKTRGTATTQPAPRGGIVPTPRPAAPTPSRSVGSRDMYDPY